MSGPDAAASPARVETLRDNLGRVRARIARAAAAVGRDQAELTLVAVSKTWPAADVAALCRLGVVDFAENREQEATRKVVQVAELLKAGREPAASEPAAPELAVMEPAVLEPGVPVWHFVGQLQSNKAAAVARFAGCVQSVDRERLVTALSRAAVACGRRIDVCIQVSLDPPPPVGASAGSATGHAAGRANTGRGGVDPSMVASLAEIVVAAEGLRLAGVMGVAPQDKSARKAFARLRHVSKRLVKDHPEATMLSAGMSGDLEDAVAEGATHLRIGTALFGERAVVP